MTNGTGQVGDFRPLHRGPSDRMQRPSPTTGHELLDRRSVRPDRAGARTATWNVNFVGRRSCATVTLQGTATGTASAPTSSANAPLNAGAGALGWMNLLGLLVLLGLRTRRR